MAEHLPMIFAALMGVAILIYVVLDGFDLGVGILSPQAAPAERDRMVASIGPFWDANETWLVLAVGILLVAFPAAHGMILSELYLPVALMLVGLILRGVSFEFRAKAPPRFKPAWDQAFFAGSLLAALSQGFMLGMYILGLQWSLGAVAFATLTAGCLAVGYSFIGACWLIWKCEGALQRQAVAWARRAFWGICLGLVAVSLATPLASPRIFDKWVSWQGIVLLGSMPLLTATVAVLLDRLLRRMPLPGDAWAWLPFALSSMLVVLAFCGLAYSFTPYIVPERLTIAEAGAAPESLAIILVGVVVVMPMILAYTALSYVIFRGKARPLSYE